MTTTQSERSAMSPLLSDEEAQMARTAQRCIMESLDRSRAASITLISDTGEGEPVKLPPQSLRFLAEALGRMAEGQAVLLMPRDREMTTYEAAHFLNVSRPFVIKEIEAGRLGYRMVGTHRRIPFQDLLAYRDEARKRQEEALRRMADNAAELGLDEY